MAGVWCGSGSAAFLDEGLTTLSRASGGTAHISRLSAREPFSARGSEPSVWGALCFHGGPGGAA